LASLLSSFVFCFHLPATSVLSTLSLHDALPIYSPEQRRFRFSSPWSRAGWHRPPSVFRGSASPADTRNAGAGARVVWRLHLRNEDRKSTRLNSSHQIISYAVFCLKKKKLTL